MELTVESLEQVLSEEDMLSVQVGVAELFALLSRHDASPEVRAAFCKMLRRKAEDSSNRVLATYLKSAANCLHER